VNLEKNTVRFLDNFSSGGRGAASTEHFLAAGYAVIHLHREGCIMPFARHFQREVASNIDGALLDALCVGSDGKIEVKHETPGLAKALREHQSAVADKRLVLIPFVTLSDYLWLLRTACEAIRPLGKAGAAYLCAAVSDFYIPDAAMAEHKIQSREGPLHLELPQTPKCLGLIHERWSPEAFCISFKLETDLAILFDKARASIRKYGMHVVVANELHTRNQKVVLVTLEKLVDVEKPESEELEVPLITSLVSLHADYIASV